MEHSKETGSAETTRTIDQLPYIDIEAAFASKEGFDEAMLAVHEQGPFARSDRGLEVFGYKECVALLRDSRLGTTMES